MDISIIVVIRYYYYYTFVAISCECLCLKDKLKYSDPAVLIYIHYIVQLVFNSLWNKAKLQK